MIKTVFQVTIRTKSIKMKGEVEKKLEQRAFISIYITISGSFKEISQVKNKLLNADSKKSCEKKWIFLSEGT